MAGEPHVANFRCEEMAERLARMEVKLDNNGKAISKLSNIVTGNGKESHGITIRLDRLEQVEETRSRRAWVVGTALTSVVVGEAVFGMYWMIKFVNGH